MLAMFRSGVQTLEVDLVVSICGPRNTLKPEGTVGLVLVQGISHLMILMSFEFCPALVGMFDVKSPK